MLGTLTMYLGVIILTDRLLFPSENQCNAMSLGAISGGTDIQYFVCETYVFLYILTTLLGASKPLPFTQTDLGV